jgi:hypothetical protein
MAAPTFTRDVHSNFTKRHATEPPIRRTFHSLPASGTGVAPTERGNQMVRDFLTSMTPVDADIAVVARAAEIVVTANPTARLNMAPDFSCQRNT